MNEREKKLWVRAWDRGTTEAEGTGCIVAYHASVMKRVRASAATGG
jgi:hypothetical protein